MRYGHRNFNFYKFLFAFSIFYLVAPPKSNKNQFNQAHSKNEDSLWSEYAKNMSITAPPERGMHLTLAQRREARKIGGSIAVKFAEVKKREIFMQSVDRHRLSTADTLDRVNNITEKLLSDIGMYHEKVEILKAAGDYQGFCALTDEMRIKLDEHKLGIKNIAGNSDQSNVSDSRLALLEGKDIERVVSNAKGMILLLDAKTIELGKILKELNISSNHKDQILGMHNITDIQLVSVDYSDDSIINEDNEKKAYNDTAPTAIDETTQESFDQKEWNRDQKALHSSHQKSKHDLKKELEEEKHVSSESFTGNREESVLNKEYTRPESILAEIKNREDMSVMQNHHVVKIHYTDKEDKRQIYTMHVWHDDKTCQLALIRLKKLLLTEVKVRSNSD